MHQFVHYIRRTNGASGGEDQPEEESTVAASNTTNTQTVVAEIHPQPNASSTPREMTSCEHTDKRPRFDEKVGVQTRSMAKDILDRCDEIMGRTTTEIPELTDLPEGSLFSSAAELSPEEEAMDSPAARASRRNSRLEHDDTQDIEEPESRNEIEQSILEGMDGIGRMARWVGIGCSAARNHGKLILSGTGSELVDAGAGAPTASGAGVILNPGREAFVYGKVTCSPQLAAAVTAIVRGERMDWRPMGLKIALYDMLREDVVTQPSGVDWAWAEKDTPAKLILPLDEEGHWHYSGIVVDTSFLEWAVRNGGNIPVGVIEDLEIWRLSNNHSR